MVNWKKVGMGVAAATIGAAAFGAVHFMFIAPQWGVGDVMGVPLNVILPFLLGALGLVGAQALSRKMGDTMKQIVQFGSAAIIGIGVSQYAGWVQTPVAAARARANVRIPTPTRQIVRPMPTAPTGAGTKII